MIYNCNTFKFIFINSIIFDKCYYDFTMVSINLSNVIDILAMAIVPFWGILVFNLNGLPFWGDATLSIWGVACPFLGHSYFRKKAFAEIGTYHGPKWPKMAQNGPKLHNYSCGCPFFGHSYFQLKCFAVWRGCNIISFVLHTVWIAKNTTPYMLTKKWKNLLAKFGKYYHFVIILLSSRYLSASAFN